MEDVHVSEAGGCERERETSAMVVLGGSLFEAVLGVVAVVLCVFGLGMLLPIPLDAVAAIIVGAAMLLNAGAVAARFKAILGLTGRSRLETFELGGGLTAEFIAGIAGVTLGVFALLGYNPAVLVAIAVIIFGLAMIADCGAIAQLNEFVLRPAQLNDASRGAVWTAMGFQLFVGVGALILGILALMGISTTVLTFVALLGAGFAVLLSGGAMGMRMLALVRA